MKYITTNKILSVISCILIILCIYWLFISTDINNKVTICVKTIYRSKAISKFVSDTRRILPYVTIIIADDSDDDYKIKNQKSIQNASPNDPNIIYIPLPYDSGLSKGRNECVKKVKTLYTIITDDTRTINHADSVYKLVDYLDKNREYDIITGFIPERGDIDKFTTNWILADNKANAAAAADAAEDKRLAAIEALKNSAHTTNFNVFQIGGGTAIKFIGIFFGMTIDS